MEVYFIRDSRSIMNAPLLHLYVSLFCRESLIPTVSSPYRIELSSKPARKGGILGFTIIAAEVYEIRQVAMRSGYISRDIVAPC